MPALHQWDYLFAFGVLCKIDPPQQRNLPLINLFVDSVAALDAYNIGANE